MSDLKLKNEVVATYNVSAVWDLEEEGINPNDIEKYYIKYAVLHIKLKDCEEWIELEPLNDVSEFDYCYHHELETF